MFFQLAQQVHQDLRAGIIAPALHLQGRRNRLEFAGHGGVVDIDPDPENHKVQAVELGAHLGEDAAELFAVHQEIVGPTNVHRQSCGG